MKTLALFLLSLIPACGQVGTCYVDVNGVTHGTAGCLQTGTPTYQTYITNVGNFIRTSLSTMAPLPQPVLAPAGNGPGSSAYYVLSDPLHGPYIFSNLTYEENYYALLKQAGNTVAFINPYVDAWLSSPSYAGACVATNPTRTAQLLTFYRALGSYIVNTLGMQLYLSFSPSINTTWPSCGYQGNTMTTAQMDGALGPMEAAAIADYSTHGTVVTGAIAIHEPGSGGEFSNQTGQVFSAANIAIACASISTAIQAATGGSGVITGCGFRWQESTYPTAIVNALPSSVELIGLDVYLGINGAAWSTNLATLAGMASASVAAGLKTGVDEFDPTPWCNTGVADCDADANLLCNDPYYNLTGVYPAWNAFISRFMSAYGAGYIAQFGTQPWILSVPTSQFPSSSCTDNSPNGDTAYVLQNLPAVVTSDGTGWKAGNTWSAASIQGGHSSLSGRSNILH